MTRSIARNPRRTLARRGFTLTEVLLVLAILGVIAAMVVPNLLGRQKEANIKITKGSIKSLEEACEQFAVSHGGDLPTTQEGVNVLLSPGNDADGKPISPYLKTMPLDAWGQPLHYEYPNTKAPNAVGPAIWSSGPDKKSDDGAGDDVTNWKTAHG